MGRATQRSIEILELIARSAGRWSHAAIARRLAIPKSSLTDLLRDLVQQQYLELSPTGDYVIGPSVLILSSAYLKRMDVVSRSRDILLTLCQGVGEASSVAVMQGTEIVVVAQERPSKPLVAAMTLGSRAPVIATAAGKAMLACMDDGVVVDLLERSVAEGRKPLKPKAKAALLAELQGIRDGGLATNLEEWMAGISAIALPVLGPDGQVAAIAVAAPDSRMTRSWLAAAEPFLRRAARDLTTRMGGNALTAA